MLVNGDRLPMQCPVVGSYEETGWSAQCPMSSQWSKLPLNDVSDYSIHNSDPNSGISMQCYNNNYYVCDNPPPQQYYGNRMYPQVGYGPVSLNLPCHGQQWDYNSMCYDVNGQPCQYTDVVDLEDFM
ncbi:unnamed protein product [Parnassius apollo]|uniref:(apollo) hypothetical protein n=1 Tax=Parnassius apollo TaxID=110799 RepID=A0A8S3VY56_PARAO|nr:unnamed protein product [Parnassius apollo]